MQQPADNQRLLRDFCAHVIQLCNYVEDFRTEQEAVALKLFDYETMRQKAEQVHRMAMGISKSN